MDICPKCKQDLNIRDVSEEIETNVEQTYRAACPNCGARLCVNVEVVFRVKMSVERDYGWEEGDEDDSESIFE